MVCYAIAWFVWRRLHCYVLLWYDIGRDTPGFILNCHRLYVFAILCVLVCLLSCLCVLLFCWELTPLRQHNFQILAIDAPSWRHSKTYNKHIKPHTSNVYISHITNFGGHVNPMAKLAYVPNNGWTNYKWNCHVGKHRILREIAQVAALKSNAGKIWTCIIKRMHNCEKMWPRALHGSI